METRRSDSVLRGGIGHVNLEPRVPYVHGARADDAEEGDRAPDDIRCVKCNAAPGDWCGTTGPLVVRPIAELQGVILHELRTSGPLGLHIDELQERIGCPVSEAVDALRREGRVFRERGLITITAAQRELEAATCDAVMSTAASLDERDRLVATLEGLCDEGVRTLQSDGDDIASWRLAFANLLEIVLRHGTQATEAWMTPVRLRDIANTISLTHSLLWPAGFRAVYAQAMHDSAWIAAHPEVETPALRFVRLIIGKNTMMAIVLGKTSLGAWLLSIPGEGRTQHVTAFAHDGGWRIHPDDLAVLEGTVSRG